VATTDPYNLQRFVDAQDRVFDFALAELRAGRKRSHWMWFVFPQLAGLGQSPTTQFYGLTSADEARAYLGHSVLGPRLRQSIEALQPWANRRSPEAILGPVDAVKLRSSLSLFDAVEPDSDFRQALEAFFSGEADERTLALLAAPG
jgi:uncharacterized protein (DUF1810 family)